MSKKTKRTNKLTDRTDNPYGWDFSAKQWHEIARTIRGMAEGESDPVERELDMWIAWEADSRAAIAEGGAR